MDGWMVCWTVHVPYVQMNNRPINPDLSDEIGPGNQTCPPGTDHDLELHLRQTDVCCIRVDLRQTDVCNVGALALGRALALG